MASAKELMRFGSHTFYVKPTEIRSFTDLKIKASLNTEEKTVDGCKITQKKGEGALTISFTAIFDKRTGADVYKDAKAMVNAAITGETGYFYTQNGKKPWNVQLMMTDAEIGTVMMGPNAKWIYAEVAVTLKQCGKGEGTNESTSSNDGLSWYTVRVPGQSQASDFTRKVKAKSAQDAIKKAGLGSYTGYVYVNGTKYYVVKGKIDNSAVPTGGGSNSSEGQSTADQIADMAAQIAESAADAAQSVWEALFGGGR